MSRASQFQKINIFKWVGVLNLSKLSCQLWLIKIIAYCEISFSPHPQNRSLQLCAEKTLSGRASIYFTWCRSRRGADAESWWAEQRRSKRKKHSMLFLVQFRLGQQFVSTSTSTVLRITSFTRLCSGLICRRKRQVCFQKNKSQLPHKHCVYWLYLEIHLFCPFGSSVGIFKNFLVQIHDLNKNQNNKIKRIPVSIWNFFQKTYQTGLSFLSSWVYSNPRGYRKNYFYVKIQYYL